MGTAIEKVIRHLEEAVLAVGLFTTTIVIFLNTVLRYGFSSSLTWAEELARYVVIWMTFIGMSVCVRNGSHVAMDVLVQRLPRKAQDGVWRLVNAVAVVASLYLAYVGWLVVTGVVRTGQKSAIMGLPMWAMYMCVPLGSLLAAKNFALNVLRPRPQTSEGFAANPSAPTLVTPAPGTASVPEKGSA